MKEEAKARSIMWAQAGDPWRLAVQGTHPGEHTRYKESDVRLISLAEQENEMHFYLFYFQPNDFVSQFFHLQGAWGKH